HEPVNSGQPWMLLGDVADALVRDDADCTVRHGYHVVIEAPQRETMDVGEIASNVKLGHLAFTAGQILHPRHPAIQEHHADVEGLAVSDYDFIGAILADLADEVADRLFFLGAQGY